MYVEGLAKKEILEDIRSRLQKVNIDCVLDSNYIEELIKTSVYSVFPTVLNSEKLIPYPPHCWKAELPF
jgi:spore germination protein KA